MHVVVLLGSWYKWPSITGLPISLFSNATYTMSPGLTTFCAFGKVHNVASARIPSGVLTIPPGGPSNIGILTLNLFELGTCDTNLSFDYKKNSTNPNPNIIFDKDKTTFEDLEFSLVYTIKSNSSLKDGKHRISISFDEATKTTYSTLNATNKYIDYSCLTDFSFILGEAGNNIQTETTGLKNVTNKLVYNDATGLTSATVTSTFTFAWGDYFNGKNPCEYGNGVGEKDESDYKEKLTKFSEDVQNKTFNINVTIASSYVTGS